MPCFVTCVAWLSRVLCRGVCPWGLPVGCARNGDPGVSNTATPEGSCVDPPYTNYRTRFAMPTADPADMFWSADIGTYIEYAGGRDAEELPGGFLEPFPLRSELFARS